MGFYGDMYINVDSKLLKLFANIKNSKEKAGDTKDYAKKVKE
jgi:hypothetical protein